MSTESAQKRRVKRWIVILIFSCLLLTIPFFIGIIPTSRSQSTPIPSATFPNPVVPLNTLVRAQSRPTLDATNVFRQATLQASTADAEYAALDATATRNAVLNATGTMRAYLESIE